MLTGAPVFDEPTPVAVALAHVQKAPMPPSQRTEVAIPASLENVILRCLAKIPPDRPQSAIELAGLLAACEGVGSWTQKEAEAWWRAHLPESFAGMPCATVEALSATR
jgi:serine/threonine-protein kinase